MASQQRHLHFHESAALRRLAASGLPLRLSERKEQVPKLDLGTISEVLGDSRRTSLAISSLLFLLIKPSM